MAYTRVKICGITRPEDAALAAECGADAIGLNFLAGPRRIGVNDAWTVLQALPPMVMSVALTSYGPCRKYAAAIAPWDIYRSLRILAFQLYPAEAKHGWDFYENEADYWRVERIATRADVTRMAVDYLMERQQSSRPESGPQKWGQPFTTFGARPKAFVLDAFVAGQSGGTGYALDWNWIAEARAAGELDGLPPIILAGGLTPENVAEAIRIVRPYAVDVSSGVEVAGKPGVKDPIKVRDFIQAAKGAL